MEAATSLLVRLRHLVRVVQSRSFERSWAAMERDHWSERRDIDQLGYASPWMKELVVSVEKLDAVLPEMEIDEDVAREFDEREWSLGSEFEVLAPRDILRGFLVPVRHVPTRVPVTLKVFAFLTINGSKDLLDRHLHQGIHYHYALADKTHTTTMICWDTRWTPDPKDRKQIRALFHELHGTGAKFASARPGRWGDEKRMSIREACEPDLQTWPIGEFRCASDGSSPVWPRSSMLTPRPPQHGKTKHGKRP